MNDPKTRNARFWVHWNDGWCKLTLSPDHTIDLYKGCRTEEGYRRTNIRYSLDDGILECETHTDESDCDGRYSYYGHATCDIHNVQSQIWQPEDEGYGCEEHPPLPGWIDTEHRQRDYSAEAAGY